ncbi:MAG: hypothetical protein MR409_06505 [Lachnospiraceae bacterium]|nr:hypothetical protein [Lachnospiraceae bacterium]
MVVSYLGTPGSGKSLHAAKDIVEALALGRLVITNFPVNAKGLKIHKKSRLVTLDNQSIKYSPHLIECACRNYFEKYGKRKVLVVLDECQLLFDSRHWNAPGRDDWNYFFSQHRKICGIDSNVILITQNEKALDKRIVPQAEYFYLHTNLKYGNSIELFISMLCGFTLFKYKKIWRSGKDVVEVKAFRGKKKYFNIYDTFMIFEK